MDNGARKDGSTQQSPPPKKRSNPNIFSRIFLCWVCPIFIKGNKRDIEEEDLIIPPSKQSDSHIAGEKLEKNWLLEYETATSQGKKPSLTKALAKTYWLSYMPAAIFVIISAVVRSIQPTIFTQLLNYWTVDSQMTKLEASYYALAIIGINIIAAMTQHHTSLYTQRFSMKIKVACSAIIYRKLMRINQASAGEVAAGKLINLLSNDVVRFDYAFMFLHNIWVTPIQVAVVLYLMWETAGYAPYVGFFSVVLIITPVQAVLTKLSAVIRRRTAGRTDKRIKLMGEIINGIQVIKMYAWEKPFQTVIAAARAYEVSMLKLAIFVRSVFLGFMLFTERTILLITCVTLILSGEMVTATLIYPIQQYFSIIQANLVIILPMAITSLSEMLVAIERMQGFLEVEERADIALTSSSKLANNLKFNAKQLNKQNSLQVTAHKYSPTSDEFQKDSITHRKDAGVTYAIEMNGVSASWTNSQDASEMTLKDMTMRVRKGKSCAIIGPVGSGKSSLLQTLLKELAVCEGSVKIEGTMSYACQDPWLFTATVRENILFGLPYDAKKYKKVTTACCLQPDFKQFPYGDLTLVGDRGVSLSGGQRARINLARAVYKEADIYLLDDPLSAVDANVGRTLFEGCINGYLRGRTVVLVTHQVHFVQACDLIVVLNEGSVEDIGSYADLTKSGKEFTLMMTKGGKDEIEEEQIEKRSSLKRVSMQRGISVKSEEGQEEQKEQVQAAEERASGSLKWEVISRYLSFIDSWVLVFAVLMSLLLTQGAATATDYWLSFWTNEVNQYIEEYGEEPDASDLDLQVGTFTTKQYMGIYGSLVVSIIVLLFVRITLYVTACIRASKNLHNTVFNNLIRSIMLFFDTSPPGRILNRFSKDLGAVDEQVPRSLLETLQMYLSMIGVLTLNALAMPYTLIPTAFLLVIFIFLLKWYLNAAQAVKRLEGTTKSPVLGKISSTLAGLSTVRCANAQGSLINEFDRAQDLHSSAFYTYIGGSSFFAMCLDGVCVMYLTIVIAIFIFVDFGGLIPLGSISLAVSQSITLTMLLQMAARFTADFLAQSTSVERVQEYSKLPAEQNVDTGPTVPPKGWPMKGHIKFERLHMRYGEEDPHVLKNLNIEIQSGWKVGVVGRTGAGKSSLITALFRLYDIEGSIKIDGIDTVGVAKQDLRAKISIIPQEPVLFSASLRYNLDPFNLYSDDDLWRALEQVEMKDAVPALDYKVAEGGSNFSVGQRQLICLARAILRSNKVLIMDEATANVDPQTDGLIQKTIREAFASCTVLTIAHRLNTIMDSDRVLVMDKGEAAEFDTPYALLSNPNTIFTFMVNETGASMSKTLFEVAKVKFFSDNPPNNETKKDN